MNKTILIALVGAAFVSTSATAGNVTTPVAEPTILTLPEVDDDAGSLMLGSGPSTPAVAGGILALLLLGALASNSGSSGGS
jgi:hypothetical protein